MINYRREIDGLRALAVVPVIFFHAGFTSFAGGFVGVDVFFVISGYLITSIIVAEMHSNTFTVLGFYERRARRILPALFVVLAACLPLSWAWLLPTDMKEFSKSLMAVSGFVSNILFWRSSGYFDSAAELKPLLHTWSLAVEEQYYLFFPLFLMLAWPLGKRRILALLIVMAIVSMTIAQWGAFNNPLASFYLLPTRGWELLIGGFVAFYHARGNEPHVTELAANVGSTIGLFLITYAVFTFDKQTPFPSLYTLAPTIGTALIILFASQQTWVGKLLGHRFLVGIGLISYSAYLWHQPLFAFARHRSQEDPSGQSLLALSLAAFVLAYFSWKYVETPFRCKQRFTRRQIFTYALCGSSVFAGIGLVGYLSDGLKSRLPPNLVWQSLGAKRDKHGDTCDPTTIANYPGILACEFGDRTSSKSILLYGDSHAQAISDELHKSLVAQKVKGIKVILDGCEMIPQIRNTSDVVLNRNCERSFQHVLSYIRETGSDVIAIGRWSFRLYPIPGEIEDMPARNSEGGKEKEGYREYAVWANGRFSFDANAKKGALQFLVDGFLSTGAKVILVYPVPEIAWDIARMNVNYYRDNGSVLKEISIPYSDFLSRNRFVNQVFSGFEARPRFVPIKPERIFCDSFVKGRCVAQYDSTPLYYDDDHLSDVGARLVVDEIMKHVATN